MKKIATDIPNQLVQAIVSVDFSKIPSNKINDVKRLLATHTKTLPKKRGEILVNEVNCSAPQELLDYINMVDVAKVPTFTMKMINSFVANYLKKL
ncbi:MAG: hypothetical protein JNL36_07675 [Candidatus Kapabacteria bacterium]|nr:hypothetical protein [Candidatus Kapabacteria bacterium]